MMGPPCIMNSQAELQLVYMEEVVPVEFVAPEPQECVVCVTECFEGSNIFTSRTANSGTPLHAFLSKFTNTKLPFCPDFAKYICRRCLRLVNVLEKAEINYVKIKTTFEWIIKKNPLFQLPVRLETMKQQDPLDSGDGKCDLMTKNTEICVPVEFPSKETCDDSKTVFIQEPMAVGGDRDSSSEEFGKYTGKSFCGEDTDGEYSPSEKHRAQSRTKKAGPKCPICQRQFSSKRNLQQHLEIHYDKKSYECNICQRRFNVQAYLRTHLKTHGEVLECMFCQIQFNSRDSYNSHMATHSEVPYRCRFCSRRFKYEGQLRYHMRMHAGDTNLLQMLLSENRNDRHLNDDCNVNVGLAEEFTTCNVPNVESRDGNG